MSSDDMFASLDAAISPPSSAQQDSQGKFKGTGGGTTPSQPVAEVAGVLVLLCEFIKDESKSKAGNENDEDEYQDESDDESEAGKVKNMRGFIWIGSEPKRFCWKTVEEGCPTWQ
jgi:hypothetical protein